MKRYGDNISREDESDEETVRARSDQSLKFFGGCGCTFGAFSSSDGRPEMTPVPKNALLELIAFFSPQQAQTND